MNVTPVCVHDIKQKDKEEIAQDIQTDLAERAPYEQSFLHDILTWAGSAGKPLFNTYVNILRHQPKTFISESEPLLRPYEPADLTAFAPTTRIEGETAVDRLDTSIIADENMFLDIGEDVDGDRLRFVMRCDKGAMRVEQAERFLNCIIAGIREFTTRSAVEETMSAEKK